MKVIISMLISIMFFSVANATGSSSNETQSQNQNQTSNNENINKNINSNSANASNTIKNNNSSTSNSGDSNSSAVSSGGNSNSSVSGISTGSINAVIGGSSSSSSSNSSSDNAVDISIDGDETYYVEVPEYIPPQTQCGNHYDIFDRLELSDNHDIKVIFIANPSSSILKDIVKNAGFIGDNANRTTRSLTLLRHSANQYNSLTYIANHERNRSPQGTSTIILSIVTACQSRGGSGGANASRTNSSGVFQGLSGNLSTSSVASYADIKVLYFRNLINIEEL